jgi:TolA-binding protein
MKDHTIETHPHGVRKMISDEDISKLESLVGSKSQQQSFLSSTDDSSSSGTKVFTGNESHYLQQLLAEKDAQIQHLKDQLSKAQDTKDELYQGLMGIQQQMGSMRLMLEQPQKPFWSRLFG